MNPVIDQNTIRRAGPDPLGVLASCAMVVNGMDLVTIDPAAIDRLVADLVENRLPPPEWDTGIHFQGAGDHATEQTTGWIFALDALNFCFWSQDPDPAYRWRITAHGGVHDGYMALAITLRDAARAGLPIWEPAWQAAVDAGTIARIFAPAPGSAPIPLIDERIRNLRELGARIQALELGDRPFTAFVAGAHRSAPALVRSIIDTFPSFDDVAAWSPPGDPASPIEVRFYKRAQILVSDLAAALRANNDDQWAETSSATLHDDVGALEAIRADTSSWGRSAALHDDSDLAGLDQLTAFADYKVPQVLRHLGVLRYREDLARTIRQRTLVESGSRAEIEIRAATVWACELLRQRLAELGGTWTAAEVDWLLWNAGQDLPPSCEPYHRTVTIHY